MQAVQVRLLNDGGFGHSENVKFPVTVTGWVSERFFGICTIHHNELHKVGFDSMYSLSRWAFKIGKECEVVS